MVLVDQCSFQNGEGRRNAGELLLLRNLVMHAVSGEELHVSNIGFMMVLVTNSKDV